MPMIDGKPVRARYTSFKMGELSAVDRPAQVSAIAHIRKRADDVAPPQRPAAPGVVALAIAKYIGTEDGAHTFQEVLQENKWSEAIWPMTDAFTQSVRSIMGDTDINPGDRETKIGQTVQEFLDAVREASPSTEKRLIALMKKDQTMKTVAELIAENPVLKTHIETIEGERDTAKAALTNEQTAHVETKKALGAATEETLTMTDGNEVKKSAVGESNFAVFKSLDERARTADVEKRVATEFPNVVGTTAEKALVLRAAERFDEPTRKAFDNIMVAAEKTASKTFSAIGHGGGHGGIGSTEKAEGEAAVAKFKGLVSAIQKRDNVKPTEATRTARAEHPDEFAAAYPDQAERA